MTERRNFRSGNGFSTDADGIVAAAKADEQEEQRVARPSLAALLTEAAVVTDDQVKDALQEGMRSGEKLGEVLMRRGLVTEEGLARTLAEQWSLPFHEAESLAIDPAAVRRIKGSSARELDALPVWFERSGEQNPERLMVAIAEPGEERFAGIRELVADTEVGFFVVPRSALDRLLHSRITADDEVDNAHAAEPALPHGVQTELELPDSLGAVAGALEASAAKLRSIQAKVESLEAALTQSNTELADRQRLVVAAEEIIERNREKIRRLEADLAERDHLLGALKHKVADLNETLEST